MHLPTGLFEDEVRRFATQKRGASGADPSRVPKKGWVVGPSTVPSSADASSMAPLKNVGAPIIALLTPVVTTFVEAPQTVTRLDEDVIIIDAPTVAPISVAQSTIFVPTPQSTLAQWGHS